jgi:hypothetical protein
MLMSWPQRVLLVLAIVALGVGAFFVVRALTNDEGGTLKGSGGATFSLDYPSNWSALSKDELAKQPGSPLGELRRDGRSGLIIVRSEQKRARSDPKFARQVERELSHRFPDFQKGSSKVIRTRAGSAFYLSYSRSKAGTVNTVVVVPKGTSSYVLDTVSPAGNADAAREIGKIILSFND